MPQLIRRRISVFLKSQMSDRTLALISDTRSGWLRLTRQWHFNGFLHLLRSDIVVKNVDEVSDLNCPLKLSIYVCKNRIDFFLQRRIGFKPMIRLEQRLVTAVAYKGYIFAFLFREANVSRSERKPCVYIH